MFIILEEFVFESATTTSYIQSECSKKKGLYKTQSSHVLMIIILSLVFQDLAVNNISFAFS